MEVFFTTAELVKMKSYSRRNKIFTTAERDTSGKKQRESIYIALSVGVSLRTFLGPNL